MCADDIYLTETKTVGAVSISNNETSYTECYRKQEIQYKYSLEFFLMFLT